MQQSTMISKSPQSWGPDCASFCIRQAVNAFHTIPYKDPITANKDKSASS